MISGVNRSEIEITGQHTQKKKVRTMKIQVAGPGCKKCLETEKNVREACTQLKLDANIQYVYDIKEIAKLGVIFTPAVIVDGKIMTSGKPPSVEELKKLLSKIQG